MVKINTVSLGALCVLVSGLVSCAKSEKPDRDTYRAPAPRIIKAGQNVELGVWDRMSQRTLDIQDALDVRNSGAVQVEVESTCRHAGNDTQTKLAVIHQEPVPIFQFLPAELLVRDLNEQEATCSFKLTLVNEHGSQHIYNINHTAIRDERQGQIVFEENSRTIQERRPRFQVSRLNALFRSPLADAVGTVECADAIAFPRNVTTVGRLEEFHFARMLIKEGRPSNVLEAKPIQLCRLYMARNGIKLAVSSPFELKFDRAPLTLRALSLVNRNDQGPVRGEPIDPVLESLRGRAVPIAVYTVENPSNYTRTIRLSKPRLPVTISARMQTSEIHTITRPWLTVTPEGMAFSEEAREIKIPPQSTLNLNIHFGTGREMRCAGLTSVFNPNLVLDFPQPLMVEELKDGGELLATLKMDLGPRLYANSSAALLEGALFTPVASICRW